MRRRRLPVVCFTAVVLLSLFGQQPTQASRTYSVRKGDTYWSIAKKFSITPYALRYANKELGNKPLQLEHRITVPDKSFRVPAHKAQVIGPSVSLRSQPAIGARKLGAIGLGEQVWIEGIAKGWCKVKTSVGLSGWMAGDFISPALDPTLRSKRFAASAQKGRWHTHRRYALRRAYPPSPEEPCDATALSSDVVRTAYAYRGTRYRYGGVSRGGFDCSGFTRHVYAKHGVRLPHSSRAQAAVGRPVSRDQLQEGDLVFFHTTRRGISHVGIYIGNGKFIHASSSGRGVRVDSLRDGYYSRKLVRAKRVK